MSKIRFISESGERVVDAEGIISSESSELFVSESGLRQPEFYQDRIIKLEERLSKVQEALKLAKGRLKESIARNKKAGKDGKVTKTSKTAKPAAKVAAKTASKTAAKKSADTPIKVPTPKGNVHQGAGEQKVIAFAKKLKPNDVPRLKKMIRDLKKTPGVESMKRLQFLRNAIARHESGNFNSTISDKAKAKPTAKTKAKEKVTKRRP